ncbi:hypothetical protein R5H53_002544 [Escherichia coli]|nr:hypothetical protein [Escherichia coli]EHZ4757284.1 hypothetical protein [Escherichia coli]EIY1271684.1 hypothetical protein [Escherichia coli]
MKRNDKILHCRGLN